MGRGLTLADARKKRGAIASAAHLPLDAVRVEAHPSKRNDLAVVALRREDPFKRNWYWDGPRNVGASIAARIDCAVGQDGHVVGVYLAPDADLGRIGQHFLVMGLTGVGKSKLWQLIYGEALCRTEVAVILCDAVKGLQTAGPLVEGLTWFADTEKATKDVIASIPRLIRDRVAYLAARGLEDWQPG